MKTIYSRTICLTCMIVIICVSSLVHGQVKDDFSDGNFTINPTWTGDTAHFEINPTLQLHLTSSGSDTSVLVTKSETGFKTEWNFWVKLSFNTSSNNFARIYLTADTDNLLSDVNGYFIQIGGGDDSISVMKQAGATIKTIFSFKSYRTLHTTNTLRLKILREDSGRWEARIDTTGGTNYLSEGSFFDNSFIAGKWFGLVCRYTSSNATKFYFDDFYIGPIQYDTISPAVVFQEATKPNRLQVGFSEPIQKQSAENPENYQFSSNGVLPDSVKQDNVHPEIALLFLHDSLEQGTIDSLRIHNIMDLSGNRLQDTLVGVYYYQPKVYDILIDEILADPDPPVELPNAEFVELYNRSAFPINLQGWTFKYGSNLKTFSSMTIPSKGYILIARDSAYLNFARCAILLTSQSSLSNEGTTLVLEDPQKHVIHSVSYSPDWFRGSFKEEGGWSLELIDPLNPCGCSENWGPSKDVFGGTPGRANSISKSNPDDSSPVGLRAVILDSSWIEVTFSESMDSLSLICQTNWAIKHPDGVKHPVRVVPGPPDFSTVKLFFDKAFEQGVIYTVKLMNGITDCAGNVCDSTRSIRFAIPDTVAVHDIIINEFLSNPASGGARFVELYNRSEKIIDLHSLVIANRDPVAGILGNAEPLSTGGFLLFPGDYLAMTSSPDDICARYHPSNPESINLMSGFPVFGDDTGTVILARKDNSVIIDRMQYNSSMHYPLLATTEGVSLERTSTDLPSEDINNWHSAAETAGFATPGYRNSHWLAADETNQKIQVQPAVFSPDNDGFEDLLFVTILENEPDQAVNIVVYDSRGRMVRQLANNVITGSEYVFIWDGMTAAGCKAPLGIYVLMIELIHPDGTCRKIKRTTVLGGKF